MRKLMILGAGPNQIPLIRAAKKNGYHVIACDYSETAPGVPFADELCLVSIMDKEGVLQAAREKQVDGVISNSEPAMPVVAYVGNALRVPANSVQTISYMSDKTMFREILGANDFRVPKHGSAKNVEQARTLALEIGFPLMIKPAASSGSRGVRKMESFDQFDTSFQTALNFSRTDEVILEEYIENHCAHVTGGDIFVLDGQVVFYGLMSCIRDHKNAPLVPMGEMYPPVLTSSQEQEIKLELSRAVNALGVRFGTINVEIMLDSEGRVFFVELNPRNGGNMIPEELYLATGFDIFGATVTAAMGEGLPEECRSAKTGNGAVVTYMVHTMETGVLHVKFQSADQLREYCLGNELLLEEVIRQHERLNEVYPNAINTIRMLISTDLNYISQDELDANEHLINFKNGLLHVTEWEMNLIPHTPSVYSTIQIPCNWTGSPEPTPVFDAYIRTLTNGDKAVERLLLEFIGVCISNVKGWRMKKSLFLVGDGDTGKSQLKSLVERLLGRGNFIGIDLKEIEARFGTGAIYGTRLAGSSDMSFLTVDELKTFKKITGGDSLFAEFKGQQAFEYTYSGLLWFCMNRLPKFGGDDGQWVYNRIMVVNCPNVIPKERQDKQLLDKMYAERAGIVYKAILALQTVIRNGYRFTEPESVTAARARYMSENSTVVSFFDECMCPWQNGKVTGFYGVYSR